jgi:acyl-lipid omega-6 desaturase (Delta-12 desaturase)
LAYRTYRHPLVLFGIGPAYQFLLRHRVPAGHPLREWRNWLSTLGTNLTLGVIVAVALLAGIDTLLIGYLLVMIGAASIGVWLFHVQHQFEASYWERNPRWNFHAAALQGSSFYDLPGVLRWLTAHIGFHHIHHLASRIPNYRLGECFEQNQALRQVTRLTLWSSLKCASLALWDEESRKLVPFSRLHGRTGLRRRLAIRA